MKTKSRLGVMIMAVWLIGTTCVAQGPGDPPVYPSMAPMALPGDVPVFPAPSPLAPDAAPERVVPAAGSSPGGLSDWIVYRRDCCEGQHTSQTPLYTEFYLQAGPSLALGTTLSRELATGWSITGGVRALFFNEPMTAAWVIDGHIINTNQPGGGQHKPFLVSFFEKGVPSSAVVFEGKSGRKIFSVQDFNRTMVGVGGGRDWYLWNPANSDGKTWRFGIDGGGRYGSSRVNFNEFGHITDVVCGLYAGGHTDVEIPWHGYIWHAGVRLEWAYTFSDILNTISDVQDLNLFVTVGVRY